jgi:hypothetical protein
MFAPPSGVGQKEGLGRAWNGRTFRAGLLSLEPKINLWQCFNHLCSQSAIPFNILAEPGEVKAS